MTTDTIKLEQLTAEQLVALQKQLKQQASAKRKAGAGNRTEYKALITSMLQEKDGSGFKHTTSDMLAALQVKKLVADNLSQEARTEELKKIQTIKQKLSKARNDKGELVYAAGSLGYKPSPHAVGPLTVDKVIAWMANAEKPDLQQIKGALSKLLK